MYARLQPCIKRNASAYSCYNTAYKVDLKQLRCHLFAQVDTYVNNLLVGKRYLDHRGTYQVTQLSTGDYFKLKISEPIFGKSTHEVCARNAQLL